ncbi:MAG: type II toxin-antitoxin system VapC family toxin [Xenococcus sp. MO_188.B8]|nr:type II toxin-antitoxin system VapC family toxin [Xenococcus sp. MO_188.B8]
MYILDTDHLTVLQRGGQGSQVLMSRLSLVLPQEVVTTIITYEEQTRGWMSFIAKSRNIETQVQAYKQLQSNIEMFCKIPVISFDRKAVVKFSQLRKMYPRLGKMDLKIAAISLVNDATLLSRNLSDFGKIENLSVEDWTIPD